MQPIGYRNVVLTDVLGHRSFYLPLFIGFFDNVRFTNFSGNRIN